MKKTDQAIRRCPTVSAVQKVLGGKWKIEILYYIGKKEVRRFGALHRHIGGITESSLTKQLRELEADGFLNRRDFRESPPRVEYTLTEQALSLMPILEDLQRWGEAHLMPDGKD